LDDTDSRKGGCTTYLACILVHKLVEENFDIIGFPRLVRLNPNIPWKTRGNGAVSIHIGKGDGDKKKIGCFKDKDIFCFTKEERSTFDKKEVEKVIKILESIIKKYAKLSEINTNSGFVLFDKKPSRDRYTSAVQNVLSIDDVINYLDKKAVFYKGYNNKRGLIGASSSIAWDDKFDRTYELITYRKKDKWGTKRFVDDKTTKMIDEKISSTFDNYDYRNNHNQIVPSSPCPVLYGIRGDVSDDLIKAKSFVKSEKIDSWIIYKSNQGTDDHLQKKDINEIKNYDSVIVNGKVSSKPSTIPGGHVIFSIENNDSSVDCAAYEPTKEFRGVIRKLIVGDSVEVYGGIREKPLTINIEKIKILKLKEKIEKIENPVCPQCGKHMKSIGKKQGFRCKKCKTKKKEAVTKKVKRDIDMGFYEVPVCARRHLSKPLKRDKQP